MSLLTIVQDACRELGLSIPSAVYSATDNQTRTMLELADKEGKELARRFDWQALIKEATFTTVATSSQTTLSTVATDFGRLVQGSMWNRTEQQPVWGPLSPQQWQQRKAAAAQTGFGNWLRIRGDVIHFFPVPPAGHTIAFEYVSKNWCQSSGGTAQSAWAADSDTALIDEEIMRLGVIWRFLKRKGLDYGEDFRVYEAALADVFGADGAKAVLNMDEETPILGLHIPEGNWSLS